MSRIKNPCKALWCVTKCWRRLHGFACTHDHISFGTILYATNMTFGRRRCKLPATPPTRVEGSIDIQHKSGCLGYFEYALYMARNVECMYPRTAVAPSTYYGETKLQNTLSCAFETIVAYHEASNAWGTRLPSSPKPTLRSWNFVAWMCYIIANGSYESHPSDLTDAL